MRYHLALVLALPAFSAAAVQSARSPAVAQAGSTPDKRPGSFARLLEFDGGVELTRGGRTTKVSAQPLSLALGDKLRTTDGRAVVEFGNSARVEIGPRAAFILEEKRGSILLSLALGRLMAWVRPGNRFEVRTPTAVCAVRGTRFAVEVAAGGASRVDVYDGLVSVKDLQGSERLLGPEQHMDVASQVRGVERRNGPALETEARREEERGGSQDKADSVNKEIETALREALLEPLDNSGSGSLSSGPGSSGSGSSGSGESSGLNSGHGGIDDLLNNSGPGKLNSDSGSSGSGGGSNSGSGGGN